MLNRIIILICLVLAMSHATQAQKTKSDSVVHFTSAQIDSTASLIPGSEKASRLLASSTDKKS
ncbi:MAG: hypothetical protein ABIS36_15710 [Chryseolinea sp.]